ncbi:PLDc N-terminal domain-containing protein [Flavobacterium sp. HSC-61S13]|uniref:PLDc N-terminal domain-containing protein n=1 Tax=Flavobacterium sp. HSC-61S13 TaxID=2910963 RepID=UPI003531F689
MSCLKTLILTAFHLILPYIVILSIFIFLFTLSIRKLSREEKGISRLLWLVVILGFPGIGSLFYIRRMQRFSQFPN